MNEAVKDEVKRLLARLQPAPKSRLSRLFLKLGAGYAAMAVFTAAALVYSSVNLYLINSSARQRISQTDIPVVTALIKMRSSLLAQESFAGKYAIFKDPSFIDLFRQRKEDAVANLELLERTQSIRDIGRVKRLYREYQAASERLFTGEGRNRDAHHASALHLVNALDELYIERQGLMQTVMDVADEQQATTIRWGIGISCAGFLLAFLLARVSVYRVVGALGDLQKETHRIATGDVNYEPLVPAVAEISELVSDFNLMALRILEMEQMHQDTQPLTRLPGNQAIERGLDERLKSGIPFAFCHLELVGFELFLARFGYAKAGELLFEAGVLLHKAVREFGTPEDFAGHAGGDKFALLVAPETVEAVCEAVIKGVDAEIHKQVHPQNGAGEHRSGEGDQAGVPTPSVCIAVIDCDSHAFTSAVEIARAAVEFKKTLEQGSGSRWQRVRSCAGKVS